MKTEEQSYWQIHDFLKGHLNNSEREAFEKLMESDLSLAEEVEKHRLANRLVIQNRLRAAEQTALKAKEAYDRNLLYRKLFTIGVALLVAMGGGYYFLTSSTETALNPAMPQQEFVEKKTEELILKTEEKESTESQPAAAKSPKEKFSMNESVDPQRREQQSLVEEQPSSPTKVVPIAEQEPLAAAKEEVPIPLPVPKEEPKATDNACSSVYMQANVFASPTCKGEHTGSIVVSRIKGGKSPYHTEIKSDKGITVPDANSLSKGIYSVFLYDDQHCSTRIDHVEVKERMCELEEKVFNPFLDELFELPVSLKNGTFVVYEKNGSVFYKKEFVAHEKEVWNGVSQKGEMETGHFTYEIIYQDGSRKQGTLTITR